MPDEEPPPSQFSVGLLATGLLVGLAIGVVAAWALRSPSPDGTLTGGGPVTTLPESAEAADAFVAAWERSRRGTFISVTEWHRITDVGAELTETRLFAQRPPDRVRHTGRSVSGSVGGVRYVCDELDIDVEPEPGVDDEEGDEGPVRECREFPDDSTLDDFDAQVDREVELMWRHVEGTRPLYRVAEVDGCFHLRLDRVMLSPPYGQRAKFCFDESTGAVRELTIERVEGTDTERVLWLGDSVSDDDLDAIVEGRFDPAAAG